MELLVITFVILAVIFFPMAGWFGLTARPLLTRARASRGWPTTPGRVTQSRVDEDLPFLAWITSRPDDSSSKVRHRPVVEYEYDVAGACQVTSVVQIGLEHATEARALEIVARYPAGAAVTVSYDPADPASAVLEPVADAAMTRLRIAIVLASLPFALTLALWVGLRFFG